MHKIGFSLALIGSLGLVFSPFCAAENPEFAMIWKVSDEDSTVFLAGSVHLLREKDFPIPAAFDRVYAESEELVFEIDMAVMTDPLFAMELRRLGSLPPRESLADKVSEETHRRLHEYLEKRDMAKGSFDRFTPGMAFLMIGSIEAARSGAKPGLGLESIYHEKSIRDGKPGFGLETAAFQMSRFNEFDNDLIEQLLQDALDEVEKAEGQLDALITAWKSGDAEALTELVFEEERESSSKVREVLLTDRNRNWIPEIERQLARDCDVMFLVGAAHLVGEGSVVEMLRERGHEVLQLANTE